MEKSALIEEACRELLEYGVWDQKARLKYLVKKYLLKKKTAPEDLIFWPTGLLAAGLWRCRRELSGEGAAPRPGGMGAEDAGAGQTVIAAIDLALSAYYERWFQKGCPVTWLDDLLAGETLLEMNEEYRRMGVSNGDAWAKNAEKRRQALEKMADYGLTYPTDETGSFPYREPQDNGLIFADTVGLACPFLYRYGAVYGRPEAMETAVKQIVNFLAYGMDAATGLPYHGYSVADDCKYGIIGWGRAAGWLLRGMGGCMTTQYGADRLGEPYAKLIDAVMGFQRKDGSFAWQLQAADGPADTSAAGMICGALKQGMELGILEGAAYGQALENGRNAIEKSIRNGRVYNCLGECEGLGQYPQKYDAYPWALGAALML